MKRKSFLEKTNLPWKRKINKMWKGINKMVNIYLVHVITVCKSQDSILWVHAANHTIRYIKTQDNVYYL